MADNYLSGLSGGVLVGGVAYSFGKWKLSVKTKAVIRNNFTSGGFQSLVKGFTDGTITLTGPYNAGNMPITCGNQYTFTLQFTNALAIVVTAQVESLEPNNDAEDAPTINVTAKSTGSFSASIT